MRISDWSSDVCSSDLACACSLKFARLHHLVLDESRKRVRRTPITPSSIRFANAPFRSEDTPSGASEQTRRNKKWTTRSEEHTSELQSLMRISYAVFCLKKKNTNTNKTTTKEVQI